MKKFFFAAAAVVCAFLMSSCNKTTQEAPLPDTLSITVDGLDAQTKAGYSTVQSYETAIRSMEILIFSPGSTDATSYLELYHAATSAEITAKSVTLSKVKTGDKKIYVVVNGPSNSSSVLKASLVKTVSELKAISIDLSDNVVSGTGAGFVAFGGKSVGASESTVSVTCSRLASRIALRSIKNSLPAAYSSMTVNRAWIANVPGNQNLGGSATVSTWYNKQSRADKTTQVTTEIINGSTYAASCPTLTFKSIGSAVTSGNSYTPSTPVLFYTYANSSKIDPSGFNASFSAQKSALVCEIEVASAGTYYYAVVLPDGLETTTTLGTNTAYTVDLTVIGLGSSDPNKPISKTAVTASISFAGWTAKDAYSESI